jgi:hypothetical protein
MDISWDFTFTPEPAFAELLAVPVMQTFRVLSPTGDIREWDGEIAAGPLKEDGTMECSVLSIVRTGSIYDREGAD